MLIRHTENAVFMILVWNFKNNLRFLRILSNRYILCKRERNIVYFCKASLSFEWFLWFPSLLIKHFNSLLYIRRNTVNKNTFCYSSSQIALFSSKTHNNYNQSIIAKWVCEIHMILYEKITIHIWSTQAWTIDTLFSK